MKSSSEYKGNQQGILLVGDMNRRQFLKAGIGLTAFANSIEVIAGSIATAGTLTTGKSEPIEYPQLPYNKIQPPKQGCLIGFFKGVFLYRKNFDEIAAKAENIDELAAMFKKEGLNKGLEPAVINRIAYYENALGSKPFIFVLHERLYSEFPISQSVEIVKRGIVPYVRACLGSYFSNSPSFGLKEIAQGKYDNYVQEFARGAAEFGKKHGGFLFTTMEEMNGGWYDWGKKSHFIDAWRHTWQIFEDQGANQYATWVWEISTPERFPARVMVDDPELYYPGDRYVDWIGLNAFSVLGRRFSNSGLDELIYKTYPKMLKKHAQKPIMQSQFARTNSEGQPKWLLDAYNAIKTNFPSLKAAIYMDNTWTKTGDHTLSPEGLQTLKDIFKDPYWIMAK
jgi:hypothetical protein